MTEFPYMPDGNTFPTIPDWKFDTLEYRNLTGNQINGLEGKVNSMNQIYINLLIQI